MTKSEKAVSVAKDVLKHFKSLKVNSGDFYIVGNGFKNLETNENAQKYLPRIVKKCEVCALGACMVSYIRLYNKVKIKELINPEDNDPTSLNTTCSIIREKLKSVFSEDQLALIETAFECINYHMCIDTELAIIAVKFGKQYQDRKERLKAIMKNIVDNKGLFIPPKLPIEDLVKV